MPHFDILDAVQVICKYFVDGDNNLLSSLLERFKDQKVFAMNEENVADFVRWVRKSTCHEMFPPFVELDTRFSILSHDLLLKLVETHCAIRGHSNRSGHRSRSKSWA